MEIKKALEESLENQKRRLKIKTDTFKNRTSLKKHNKTIYSKE